MQNQLTVAISSRALFDMTDSHRVYQEQGLAAYSEFQIAHEDEPLAKGGGFQLVEKLLHINKLLGEARIEVILLSRNSADTGLRVFNSIEHYGLDVTRAAFCSGESPYRYVNAFGSHLFLSTDAEDVRSALRFGVAAATLLPRKATTVNPKNQQDGVDSAQTDLSILEQQDRTVDDSGIDTPGQLRFAFDGDAVLFSDEAEKIYKRSGLEAFTASEQAAAKTPLTGGPFKLFLSALHGIQAEFEGDYSPIRTALVTARSAPAHERVIRTLRAWKVRIDESLFLGGMAKADFLRAYGADVFFDDQKFHCEPASETVATGHVPHGVANQ